MKKLLKMMVAAVCASLVVYVLASYFPESLAIIIGVAAGTYMEWRLGN